MSYFRDTFYSGRLAACASVGLFPDCCAGCFFSNFSIIPDMTGSWYCLLFLDYCITDTAVASLCLSFTFTSCCYRFIFHFNVTCFRYTFCSGLLAIYTGINFFSGFCTGCLFYNFTFIPDMSNYRHHFLLFNYCIAYATVASFCFSCCLTSGCYRCVFYCLVACGCYCLCSCFLATGTGVGLRSGCSAGRCLCYLSAVPAVT